PSDNWTVSLTAAGQHLRSDDTHYTTPGLGLTRFVRIAEPHVNDIELATATIRHSWGWAEFTSSTGYVRHAYGSLFDATATQDEYTSFALVSAYSERTRTKMLVQDAYLTSRGAGRLEWLAGVYGSDTRVDSPTEFLAQVPDAPNMLVYGDDRQDRIRELAAYGEITYKVAPSWTLAVGGRLFNIHTDTVSRVVSERFPPRDIDTERDFTGFSPKVSIQKEFASGDLAYAVVSEGYRAGGVNSGGANPLSAERETFRRDRLVNFELGLKLALLEKRLQVNSAVFYDIWTDIQTDQFRNTGIPYTTNVGDAHILGLETEFTWLGPGGLSAQLSGRFSRIRTTNANPDFAPSLVDGLPGAATISAGGLITYERDLGVGDWLVRLVAQANYVGRSRVTFDTSVPAMGGYARTKFSAEIAGTTWARPMSLQVYVVNPLNSYNDTFAFGNPFNPNRTRQITPQRPRTIGVSLSTAL
ncbi:MAG: TonB-dependent receptor, partial [Dehalococcoidia bacterium]|nr:TonB-dependent receptor [Dehalococcoidia bacterium]